jgi:hypothetical protein
MFDRDELHAALEALVDRIAATGATARIAMIGGAAMAFLAESRDATRDVDATLHPRPVVLAAAHELALERGWPEDWINDKALAFWSDDAPLYEVWTPLIDRDGVRILLAPPELLLAMKLLAGRGRRDFADIKLLVQHLGITSISDAITIFDKYYRDHEIPLRALHFLEEYFSTSS